MDTISAAIQMERSQGEILRIHLTGQWQIDKDAPSADIVDEKLRADPGIRTIEFDTQHFGPWDSNVLTFLTAIMTGIIMAGRTGAAFAAQMGTMQVNEEIDALKTLAVSPMEFLVLPRMLALTLMMPLLTLFGNLIRI